MRSIGKGPRKSSSNQIIDKDQQEVASGKQYMKHACPQDKLEFKVFLALRHPGQCSLCQAVNDAHLIS